MLTVETFKKRLTKVNSPDWLSVAIDANNVRQLYVVVNGGMGNTISTPIERYPPEIKEYVDKNLGRKRPSFKTSLADLNIFLSDLIQSAALAHIF